jgi:hypothetical protein
MTRSPFHKHRGALKRYKPKLKVSADEMLDAAGAKKTYTLYRSQERTGSALEHRELEVRVTQS